MVKQKLNLSPLGQILFDKAVDDTRNEYAEHDRVRTKFYYSLGKDNQFDCLDLRTIIDDLVQQFNLKYAFNDRSSNYTQFLITRAFELFKMKLQRLSPEHYLIVTRKKDKHIMFALCDPTIEAHENIVITWDTEALEDGRIEYVPFHFARELLDLE